ncbi:MAG: hypothetical protein KGS72_20710 [Cyanobacteria bacterium REEB67]|nr:hypothetical protein [Cyanobacteria bacterium REEB67]
MSTSGADNPSLVSAGVSSAGAAGAGVSAGAGGQSLFPFSSHSLAQLAVGSSVVIATLLSLPDGIALIPGATSIISWTLRVIGNWVIGAVLWFVGFSALVQLLRLVSRGVIAGPSGLKLSRFDRLIAWSDIQAISLEPNDFFTRIFSLKVPARKLTIFFRFTARNKLLANLLFPNFIPSFFFTKETFDALVRVIFERSQILPISGAGLPVDLDHDYAVFAYRPEQLPTVRNTFSWLKKQRIIVTLVVAISLIVFLGRKAAVNYSYNSALKAYRQGRLEKARQDYRLSVRFDPTFAAGWNGLAQTEFHLAEIQLTDFERARKYWVRALWCKPDYVEPRFGLARLAFYQRKFADASDNIEHAAGIDPQNSLAILEHAEFAVRYGRPAIGLREARLLVSEAPDRSRPSGEYAFIAHCLIAQAKLDMKDIAGAAAELAVYKDDPADYRHGENVTYMFIVKSRLLNAQKKFAEAEKLALAAVRLQPRNEEALVQAAASAVACGHKEAAARHLNAARALGVRDPWIEIVDARASVAQGQIQDAIAKYGEALAVPDDNQDAIALATIYSELSTLPLSPAGDGDAAAALHVQRLLAEAHRRALSKNPIVFQYFK